ncbi:MAG TPA: AAA family ATPase, partial [Terriglobales bacterium]|nr:AAA family ATPase [Terriglobales bacterium]
MCPTEDEAEEALESRKLKGVVDPASVWRIPRELAGQFRYRLNSRTHWQEWKYVEDEDQNAPLFHTYEQTINAPPLAFAIEGFLQEDGVTFIGGPSGHGKTLIMLSMARALLNGTPLFGYEKFEARVSEKVIYLVPESSLTPFVHRLKLFGLLDAVQEGRFLYRTLSAAGQVNLQDTRLLEAVKGADVFLDTAVRFAEGEENSASDNRVFAQNLFALLRAGARTVTGAHHSPKGFVNQEAINLENALRGSGDIGAMLTTAWAVQQVDMEANRIYVKNVKPRDFQPCQPFEIEGRPHIDKEGDFKMVTLPGSAKS